jgi:hypothetical protein
MKKKSHKHNCMQNLANFGIAHLNSELKNIAKIELVFGIKN